MRRGPFDRLAVAASLVFIADFATKRWAVGALGDGDRLLGAGWHLTVIRNTHLAGGLETGGFELALTGVLTAAVAGLVLKVCRQLSTIDETAPLTLGLLVGAGLANLADALLPPHGVVDFIAFTSSQVTTSFNVADVLLAVGLVLCVRTIWRIALTMRGRIFSRDALLDRPFSGVFPMRDRMLLSAGHALLAMCAFVWLYSMAIAFTPDAGHSAPNSLLCGLGVFAMAFVTSQTWLRLADRRLLAHLRSLPNRSMERVVLDSSLPVAADLPLRRPRLVPRRDVIMGDEPRASRPADNT